MSGLFLCIETIKNMITLNSYNFKGKKAIVRVDFNVPLDADFNITDFTRINAVVPTVKKILSDGGSAILMSHLGRPKDGPTDKYSLKHIVKAVSEKLGVPVAFADDCIGTEAKKKAADLKSWRSFIAGKPSFLQRRRKR